MMVNNDWIFSISLLNRVWNILHLLVGIAYCRYNGHDWYTSWPGLVSSQHPHPSHVRPQVLFTSPRGVDNCLLQHFSAVEQHDFHLWHSSLSSVEQISFTSLLLWMFGTSNSFFITLYKYGIFSDAINVFLAWLNKNE
jgi:hypothetical protein